MNIFCVKKSVQFSSVIQSCPTLFNTMAYTTPGFPVHHQLLEFTQIHVRWVGGNHLTISSVIPFSSRLQFSPASGSFQMNQFFTSGGQSIGASASASVLPMNIQDTSFRIDWLDLLAVQGTLKSLLQYHSSVQSLSSVWLFVTPWTAACQASLSITNSRSKASVLQCTAFFIVQLSHPYITPRKTIALTRWTSVGKVMSLLFNMLSRLFISFLPMSKRLLISWLQSPSAVILELQKVILWLKIILQLKINYPPIKR